MSIPRIEDYPIPTVGAWAANRVAWWPERHHCAVLIHDMQRYFLQFYPADASLLREMVANIAALRRRCHALNVPVFYSQADDAQTPAERGLATDFWGLGMDGKSGCQRLALHPPRRRQLATQQLAMSWRWACQSIARRFRWNHIRVSRRGCLPAMNCSMMSGASRVRRSSSLTTE
ncbi:isochorismatase family protein [Verminephrobacter aporrectodeae subsp. tuberculatae]|nr:isochorismatase family protein [Verminephrobacter aporrectodeae subsp. tuberculatae]MCW5289694.1 isochorismatase family protein [Verminephrobacter aporrectodeae subsp. tuberculatae]MCW8176341.1 isochorismatase family protein [Verminephrobacter aporrectodeae subsp. tuberculatae]MCW8204020.1 isochorismatase family protein [Verminephrobacter aporrectodeae subsp. tuberculatae]